MKETPETEDGFYSRFRMLYPKKMFLYCRIFPKNHRTEQCGKETLA